MSTAKLSKKAIIGILAGVVVLIVGILYVAGVYSTSFSKADGGHVDVVRNGGLFDDNSIRQVIPPNSGLTYTGWFSVDHKYPTSQRFYKVSAAAGSDSNEVINVPTSDGVSLGIEGTFYFTLNWQDTAVLKDFDNKFGTRKFEGKAPWDGDDGWQSFLNASLGNLVQNTLRQQIGAVKCSDLLPSCVLIQNTSGVTTVVQGSGNETIQQVQAAVNKSFETDVKSTLGGNYFTNIQFVLSKVTPPDNIQQKINEAQAAFAGNASAQADQQQAVIKANTKLKEAQLAAQANEITQKGYESCPVCSEIDKIKALPPGLLTYVPGNSSVVVGNR